MKRPVKIIFILVICSMLSSIALAEYPQYTVKKTTGKILIDGIINEADWAAAPVFSNFLYKANTDSTPVEKTEARMLWDNEFLYLAVKCEDKNIMVGTGRQTPWNSNSGVSADDCIELFWNPNPADTLFYQFEINCIGIALSKMNHKRDRKIIQIMPPHVAQTFQGTVNDNSDTDTGWTMEIAMRFTDYPQIQKIYEGTPVLKPKAGDKWRINVNRSDAVFIDGQKVNRASLWSPNIVTGFIGSWFHCPRDFGYLHFSNDKVR